MADNKINVTSYLNLLNHVKDHIGQAQLLTAKLITREMNVLYWEIGKSIVLAQKKERWGTQIIENLAKDIQGAYPGIKGFSRTNIFCMRTFYLGYFKNVQKTTSKYSAQPIFLIPWGHNLCLMEKLDDVEARLWYAQRVVELGWSRKALSDCIRGRVYERQGKALTNFSQQLEPAQAIPAQERLKDPYDFGFLTLPADYKEKELEQKLVDHMQKFLMELGAGFAFVGRQYPISVEGTDYYLDLLFYHTRLHCYVIVELKASEFKPEFAGKMNFYLVAADTLLKRDGDNPSLGMILCEEKNHVKVEYAFRNCTTPIGVATYEVEVTADIPYALAGSLPTQKQIEAALQFHKRSRPSKKNKKSSMVQL